ncbi:MAG: hypothetical protein ACTSUE_08555, partial [Promethearchaeota archaeon]
MELTREYNAILLDVGEGREIYETVFETDLESELEEQLFSEIQFELDRVLSEYLGSRRFFIIGKNVYTFVVLQITDDVVVEINSLKVVVGFKESMKKGICDLLGDSFISKLIEMDLFYGIQNAFTRDGVPAGFSIRGNVIYELKNLMEVNSWFMKLKMRMYPGVKFTCRVSEDGGYYLLLEPKYLVYQDITLIDELEHYSRITFESGLADLNRVEKMKVRIRYLDMLVINILDERDYVVSEINLLEDIESERDDLGGKSIKDHVLEKYGVKTSISSQFIVKIRNRDGEWYMAPEFLKIKGRSEEFNQNPGDEEKIIDIMKKSMILNRNVLLPRIVDAMNRYFACSNSCFRCVVGAWTFINKFVFKAKIPLNIDVLERSLRHGRNKYLVKNNRFLAKIKSVITGNNYQIIEKLPSGRKAVVWRVVSPVDSRVYAFKVYGGINEQQSRTMTLIQSVLKQATEKSKKFVRIYEIGSFEYDGSFFHYHVMDFHSGKSLAKRKLKHARVSFMTRA